MELLARHGIMDELQGLGTTFGVSRIFVKQKFVFEMDIKDLDYGDTQYGTPLMISQAETEHVLDKALEKYGKKVERPVKAERVEQDDEGVTAWLCNPDGTEERMHCKYVVGCDGAHSIVRKAAGQKFNGGTYPQDFSLADVHLKWDQPTNLYIMLGSSGFLACLPLKDGLVRFICSRPREWGTDTEPTIEDFKTAMEKLAPGKFEILDSVWIARFRLHHRIVEKYRVGRMLLAGDAAHVHSPVGGQGMNAGMHDSINLGWKLASVLRGEKDDSFLDSYHTERHRIGTHLLRQTDRAFEFISTRNRIWLFLRNTILPWIMPWAMRDRNTRALRVRFISQLGVRYRDSPIVGSASTWRGALKGGNRAPDGKISGLNGETNLQELFRGPGHHLLLFSGTGSKALDAEGLENEAANFKGPSVKIHKILNGNSKMDGAHTDLDGSLHKLYGFAEAGYVLVRPDGYISFIGAISSIDELKKWTE
jgi:2-polyprenyl-6-methoxyphenol hydroxylase-like FAD-dependent oxidoreductase